MGWRCVGDTSFLLEVKTFKKTNSPSIIIRHRFRKPKGRKATIASNVLFLNPRSSSILDCQPRWSSRIRGVGPLMRTGILGRDLVYKEEVLKEACLQTLLNEPDLVNTGSVYGISSFLQAMCEGWERSCMLLGEPPTSSQGGNIEEAMLTIKRQK